MRFPDSFLDEIRARLPISQVVGRHVQWDRKRSQPSRGDYWACCPFHHEKTPSFHVDDRKGFYYCFGCHAKGDHFRFLVEKEGLNFAEAVAQLASEAGLELPKPDPKQQQREQKRLGLMEVLEEAAAFYQHQLRTSAGHTALAYAREQRGLDDAVIERFRIGAAPDARDTLLRHLQGQGVDVALMAEAGLVAVPEGGGKPYDRFRNRLMFPIRDVKGRVIAFGGRALGEARAKYLNSPETPVFHKSHVLYNLDQARKSAFERDSIIVVEGYMDVVALHQAGFPHAVAPLGTALTQAQLALLWRVCAQPVLCFDGDAAGQKAAWRALEVALPQLEPGHSLRFVFLPEGMDPDDMLRLHGPEAFARQLEQAEPLVDFLFRQVSSEQPLRTPEERAALQMRLEELAARITDATVRQYYRDELRDRLRALFGRPPMHGTGRKAGQGAAGGRSAGRWPRGGQGRAGSAMRNGRQRQGGQWGGAGMAGVLPPSVRLRRSAGNADVLGPLAEQDLLRLLLLRPDIVSEVAEALADFSFSSQALDSLLREILDICTTLQEADSPQAPALDTRALLAHLQGRPAGRVAGQLATSQVPARLAELVRLPQAEAAAAFIRRLEEMRQRRQLQADLALAERAFEQAPTAENLEYMQRLRQELDACGRMDED